MKKDGTAEPGCYCEKCEQLRFERKENARAAAVLCIKLNGAKPDNPLRSCIECKAPVYIGKAAANRPDLPIWAWQYETKRVDWGIEYAAPGSAPARCPRCRRKHEPVS